MDDQPIPETFKESDNIPEPYLTAIGKVVVNWCLLESVVDLSIGKLSGVNLNDPRGVIFTAHMTWPQKMDILGALVHALKKEYPHLEPRYNAAKPFLTNAQKGRNRIVHGQWGVDEGAIVKLKATARGKLKFGIEPITLDEIKAISLEIGNAGLATLKMILNL
jgi:hypothetical protein